MADNTWKFLEHQESNPEALKQAVDSKCVSMLIDEEGLLKDNETNLIGSYLYGVDQHGQRIVGNVLFVTDVYEGDGISFTGIEPETFEKLHEQLKNMAVAMKATVQSMKGAKA